MAYMGVRTCSRKTIYDIKELPKARKAQADVDKVFVKALPINNKETDVRTMLNGNGPYICFFIIYRQGFNKNLSPHTAYGRKPYRV